MSSAPLASRAGRALGLTFVNTLATRLGTLVIGVALARIVGPEDFGTFAIGLLALTAMLSFSELGVSLAIVRWPDSPREIAPTVATISTISATFLCLVSLAAAPWFCEAMDAPDATNVVRLLSVAVLISGVVATPAALLQREFRAGRRMLIDQVGAWTGALVSISTAIAGLGAMSLAIGRLAGVGISAVMFLASAPIRFGFDPAIARRLLSFGLPLAGSSIVVFAVTYVDQFLVASLLGPVALGFYFLAFNLSSWPVTVFSQPVRQVSPATFARLQGDPPAMRRSFVLSAALLAAVTLPVCAVLSGAAGPLIDFVYGSEWSPAAAALVWLGVAAALRILCELVYDYFVVLGSTRVVFAVQVVWLVALAPAVYVGAELAGIAGASAGHVVVAAAIVIPIYLVELRRVGIGARELGRAVAAPVAYGAAVCVLAYAASRLTLVDPLALAAAGLAAAGALALQAPRIRSAVRLLRSAVTEGSSALDPDRMSTPEQEHSDMSTPRIPVSIVCVAGDAAVRERNLDRSIADHLHEAPDTEYLPLDNSTGAFASAGQAFNHGAQVARHDFVVFVHQDVYLHSLRALEEVAAALAARPDIGLHGSAGIAPDGRIVGCMRDRVVVLGERVDEPTDVDSLDEVLFMAPREAILREPVTEAPDLEWHAYAVEYGLRVRSQGKRVTAGGIPLTHNSLDLLAVNSRLPDAHRALARMYPSLLPVRTTCGVISDRAPRRLGPLHAHRWRYRWLRDSLVAHSARRALGGGPVVLSDIRHDIDRAMGGSAGVLQMVNLEKDPAAASDPQSARVDLVRGNRDVSIASMSLEELDGALARRRGRPLLITNLSVADLRRLRDRLPARERVAGYNGSIGCWVLLGEPAARWAEEPLGSRRSTPFGMARPRAA